MDQRCCGPMLSNFLSYPPEVKKTNCEMVLNNKDTAARDHPSEVGCGNSICTRLRCFRQE